MYSVYKKPVLSFYTGTVGLFFFLNFFFYLSLTVVTARNFAYYLLYGYDKYCTRLSARYTYALHAFNPRSSQFFFVFLNPSHHHIKSALSGDIGFFFILFIETIFN